MTVPELSPFSTPHLFEKGYIVDCYLHLGAADLVNVSAYAEAYPDDIAKAIRLQDEADEILDIPKNIP
ncbi:MULTISPECIES: hypothetical protein [unclassified Microcoleus]|uniref:hypothetical protein n=1 Tax=unclassified Microcoleus TaxID=2642155 RepID=UPI002FD5829B